MRYSLKNRICAVLLCVCTLLMSGCFPVRSMFQNGDGFYVDPLGNPNPDPNDAKYQKRDDSTVKVTGKYPNEEGAKDAFHFENCPDEGDINDFKIIGYAGNTFVYFYTGVTASNQKFWTIAAYDFIKEEYEEIMWRTYGKSEEDQINCNPVTMYTYTDKLIFMVNVKFYYFRFSVSNTQEDPYHYSYNNDLAIWELSDDNKKSIRKALGINDGSDSFCCSDLAAKSLDSDSKYSASFMSLPKDGDDFDEKNVLFELGIYVTKDDNGAVTSRYIKTTKKEDNIVADEGGNLISSNNATGNCVYLLGIDRTQLRFSVDCKRDKNKFEIAKKENDTLLSFAVLDYKDASDTASTTDSRLELVFEENNGDKSASKYRIEYYRLIYDSGFIGIGEDYYARPITKEAEYLDNKNETQKSVINEVYTLDDFSSTFLASDNMKAIDYYSNGVDICSTSEGFKRLVLSFNQETKAWEQLTLSSDKANAAFFSEVYSIYSLVVGFSGKEFERTVRTYDKDDKLISTEQDISEYTLAQLPFAKVRYVVGGTVRYEVKQRY